MKNDDDIRLESVFRPSFVPPPCPMHMLGIYAHEEVCVMPNVYNRFPLMIQTMVHRSQRTDIYFPRVTMMPNVAVQQRMNKAIIDQVHALIAEQQKVQIQGATEMNGYFEIKTNERSVLSLLQVNYAYTPPMAHGMTFAKSLTFDTRTGKNYSLSELFKPGSSYVQAISEQIRVQLKERNLPLLEEFKGIAPDQDYYIADKALVIYFQLYEITPYYVGFPMFPISVYSLEGLIAEDTPLARMLPDV